MPQMAPISWLSLFFIFSITLMIFCTLNYFSFMPINFNKTNKNNLMSTNPMNWKW